jgi:hypothetical protein
MFSFRSAILTCAIALTFAPSAHAAGAFGMELGEHVRNYVQDTKPVFTRHELKMFEVAPPKPDPRFDTYAVDTHKGRIIRIMASSPDDRTPDAQSTLAVYGSLKQELMQSYGEPSLNMGEVADAGDELLAHLVYEGGLEVLEWDFVDGNNDGLGAVYVFLAGAEDEQGVQASYCTLYMESPDYAELSEAARLHEDTADSVLPTQNLTENN